MIFPTSLVLFTAMITRYPNTYIDIKDKYIEKHILIEVWQENN
jgi:hypothetical protein